MSKPTWGRSVAPSWGTRIFTYMTPLVSVPLVYFYYVYQLKCDMSFQKLWENPWHFDLGFDNPSFFWSIVLWYLFQIILAKVPDTMHYLLPSYVGGVQEGAHTPAGNILIYNINGLQALLVSIGTFSWLVSHDVIDPVAIHENWFVYYCYANLIGFALTFFAHFKAIVFPTHPGDVKRSGDEFYDMIMGAEHNPRMFGIDFKLFFNGRPGIIGWTIINLCALLYQHSKFGYVTNSMLLVNVLQFLYVADFFWNEYWYLRTIDIAHEHFGFYLAWGDSVWLPFIYTLQGLYLSRHPVNLPYYGVATILFMGCWGYYVFRLANHQKDKFRQMKKMGKEYYINGKPAKYVDAEYVNGDGKRHQSWLLADGCWGSSRHMNYMGDLTMALAWCLCTGFNSLIPYTYFFFMSILLFTRCIRDETKCSQKYGESWKKYCEAVPYRFIPYVY